MTRRSTITAIVLLTALNFGFFIGSALALGKPAPQQPMSLPSSDIRLNSLGYLPNAPIFASKTLKMTKPFTLAR
jgi:hypothetical protein